MTYKYEVHSKHPQRIALISFRRAVTGSPKLNHPDIDDRGYFGVSGAGTARGPILGVTEGDTVFIELKRERISENADLFVTSSDSSVMTVTNKIGTNHLAYSETVGLKVTGVKGSGGVYPKKAEILVQYGDKKVIVGAMTVWVFTKISLLLTPHIVTIKNADGNSSTPSVDVNKVIDVAKAVWQPCGISFTIPALPKSSTKTFRKAGELWSPYIQENSLNKTSEKYRKSELGILFNENHSPKSINIYFVNKIVKSEEGTITEAFAINPINGFNISVKPGIAVSVDRKNSASLGKILAHEIGHFLRLPHIDFRESDSALEDAWSKRMMMYPLTHFETGANTVSDVGYGKNIAGTLITLKDLNDVNNSRNHSTDGEWLTARNVSSSMNVYEY